MIEIETTGIPNRPTALSRSNESPISVNDASVLLAQDSELQGAIFARAEKFGARSLPLRGTQSDALPSQGERKVSVLVTTTPLDLLTYQQFAHSDRNEVDRQTHPAMPDRHRICTGQTRTLTGRTAPRLCAHRRRKGCCLPFRSFPRVRLVSHIFSIAGSNTGRRGRLVKAAFFAPRSGRSERRALTGLPRSVHSPARKWEITRSSRRAVLPARRFLLPGAYSAASKRLTVSD